MASIKFKVVGPRPVNGIAPGGTGSTDDREWAERAEQRGHIKVQPAPAPKPPAVEPKVDEPDGGES